ncbi:MAG TPA: glycoside hydrolase family 31 protein, partial [Opitutales bacterium]|nr:glycoside hydrolase family 31 protein [Opitutales bacterium]
HCRWFYEGQRKANENKRVVILTRSAYAGHQRYGAMTWSGDVASRWEDLKKQITCGINFCAAGIPYWTTDIGGFAVEPRYERAIGRDVEEFRELNMRWYQFGVFNPLFRVHGQFPYREVFRLCPEGHPVYESMVEYNKLRYRLMPWLYSMVGSVSFDDYTMMRPLFMDFPKDAKVRDIADEFLFGSILVAPVTDFLARSRKVYLPKGADWYDFHTGALLKGGKTITADAPLSEIPLFVKAGSIIPMGGDIAYADENPDGPLQIRVYPGADATFTLYEDEGDNYNCENGAYARTLISWNDAEKTLTIGERDGSFPGMAEKRKISVVIVGEGRGAGKQLEAKPDKSLTYSGKAVSVKL